MFLVPTFGVASFKSVNNSNGYTVAVSALLFSLVTKDVEPWTVVAGNPAKFIKKRELK